MFWCVVASIWKHRNAFVITVQAGQDLKISLSLNSFKDAVSLLLLLTDK
jgi:hypothetical protein